MAAVPFVDLSHQYRAIAPEAEATFARIAQSGGFILGADVEAFEEDFAAYCGAEHCVGVGNGTDAIKLALEAVGAGPGRTVVTAPMTFIATVEAIAATGARPVLVDIDPATRCLDPAGLEAALGPDTAAVVPVHLYGRPAPMDAIHAACQAAGGIPIIEDAAQAHGATVDGRRTGSLATAAAFSFYPTKNLGAMGDGGAVTTSDPDVAAVVRSLRHHGAAADDANDHGRRGWTARLDALQAALLALKLPHLDRWNEERREAARRYREALDGADGVVLPSDDADGATQVFHLFVVQVEDRDRVLADLRGQGIGAAVHYPTPVHLQTAWSELGERGSYPHAERLAATGLSLPMYPGISAQDVEAVARAVRAAVGA